MEEKTEKDPREMTEKEYLKALAGRIKKFRREGNYGESKFLPLVFKRMLRGPEDARILLNLPGSPADIAPKVGMTEEEVESRLKVLGEKGLAFLTRRGWFMPRSAEGQLHDVTLCTPQFDEEYGDEFFLLWEAFGNLEYFLEPRFDLIEEDDQKKRTRILPDRRALAKDIELAPWEDLKVLFDVMYNNEGKLGLFPCSCKRAMPGDPLAEDYWTCMVFARAYEYWKDKGNVKTLTADEMLEAVEKMHEERGLCTIAPNAKNFATVRAVQMFCNCHPNHCDVMIPPLLQGIPLREVFSPSRYLMRVKSTTECKACQACVERCIFGAAQMKYDPQTKKWKAWVDPEKCMGCGNCALVCPIKNRELVLIRPAEYVPDENPEAVGN